MLPNFPSFIFFKRIFQVFIIFKLKNILKPEKDKYMIVGEITVDLQKKSNTKIFYECTIVQVKFYKIQINTCQFERDV